MVKEKLWLVAVVIDPITKQRDEWYDDGEITLIDKQHSQVLVSPVYHYLTGQTSFMRLRMVDIKESKFMVVKQKSKPGI